MEDEDEFGPVNLNDEEMDHFEIHPIKDAVLPSWWKHTKEGKAVLDQLTQCQERLAEAEAIFNKVFDILDRTETMTPALFKLIRGGLKATIEDKP